MGGNMDYKSLEKDQLKGIVEDMAEAKDFELPKGYHLMGVDKLSTLAEEVEAYQPQETETLKKVDDGLTIKGNSTMKERILADERVTVYIPEDQISKTNYVDILLNGVHFVYAREKEYQMPKCIADIWYNAVREERKARKKMSTQVTI